MGPVSIHKYDNVSINKFQAFADSRTLTALWVKVYNRTSAACDLHCLICGMTIHNNHVMGKLRRSRYGFKDRVFFIFSQDYRCDPAIAIIKV